MSVTRGRYPSAQPVYVAAALRRDRCLVQDLALFDDRAASRVRPWCTHSDRRTRMHHISSVQVRLHVRQLALSQPPAGLPEQIATLAQNRTSAPGAAAAS